MIIEFSLIIFFIQLRQIVSDCPPPYVPAGHWPPRCDNGYKTGSRCDYRCMNGYKYDPNFPRPKTVCQASGQWDPAKPTINCILQGCTEEFVTPHASKLISCTPQTLEEESTDGKIGTKCTFQCRIGFTQITKTLDKYCAAEYGFQGFYSGNWLVLPSKTACQRLLCSPPPDTVPHAVIYCRKRPPGYGNSCEVDCDPGYKNIGKKKIQCRLTETNDSVEWTSSFEGCTIADCPVITKTNIQEASCTDQHTYGSTCTYGSDSDAFDMTSPAITVECTSNLKRSIESEWTTDWSDYPSPAIKSSIECPKPDKPANAHSSLDCTVCTTKGSVCTVECLDGYTQDPQGNATMTCLSDGTWDKQLSPCIKDVCDIPLQLNGVQVICTDKHRFGSVCTFECKIGYFLPANGIDKIECIYQRKDGTSGMSWDHPLTPCAVRECAEPPLPDNGYLEKCTLGLIEGSECSFHCLSTHEPVSGSQPVITCVMSDGELEWDTPPMFCKEKAKPCLEPPLQENGSKKTCSDFTNINSTCSYECNAGYELPANGISSVKCVVNEVINRGVWDANVTACKEQICSQPPDQLNGARLNCDEPFSYLSTCTFKCNPGYVLSTNGVSSITCDLLSGSKNVEWNKIPSPCEKSSCPDPPDQINGVRKDCPSPFKLNSVCTFECKPGYKLPPDGIVTTTCVADGDEATKWDETPTSCVERSCPTPTNPANGAKLECNEPFLYLTKCTFLCNPGYEIPTYGISSITCNVKPGTSQVAWNNEPTACKKKTCPTPTDPNNGAKLDCNEPFVYQSKCTFYCDPGYELPSDGIALITCDVEPESPQVAWDKEPTACEKKSCVLPPDQTNGAKLDCPVPYLYLSNCTFQCDPGYILPTGGVSAITCDVKPGSPQVAWNKEPTPCEKGSCDVAPDQVNGVKKNCTEPFKLDSVCTYECEPGYEVPTNGVSSIKCVITENGTNNQWDKSPTPCIEKICSDPPDLVNSAKVNCPAPFIYGNNCSYKCNPGYELPPDPVTTITCDVKQGTDLVDWDNTPTPCEKKRCLQPPNQINGVESNCPEPFEYQTKCSYKCNSGYALAGDGISTITCDVKHDNDSVEWNNDPSPCEASSCPTPPDQVNGARKVCPTPFQFDSVCTFACNPGYELPEDGVSSVECIAISATENDWDNTPTPCVEQSCLTPVDQQNGAKLNCTAPFLYSSDCTFKCDPGYELPSGNMILSIRCDVKPGSFEVDWNKTPTPCQQQVCSPPPEQVEGARLDCPEPFLYKNNCTYQCNAGYELPTDGISSLTCDVEPGKELVKWDNNPSPCQEQICNLPPLPEYGYKTDCDGPYKYRTLCTFKCDDGYEMPPDAIDEIQCDVPDGSHNVQWNNTPSDCIKQTCPPPTTPLNGHKAVCPEPFTFGRVCTFECDNGYELPADGIDLLKCDVAPGNIGANLVEWNDTATGCKEQVCLSPPKQLYGHETVCPDPFIFRTVCNFECDDGYELPPNATSSIQCVVPPNEANIVRWNAKPSNCQEQECKPPPGLSHGHRAKCPDPFIFRTECDFECNNGYEFPPDAITIIKCDVSDGSNGIVSWNNTPTACIEQECAAPLDPVHGHRAVCPNPFTFRTVCTFKCDSGYELPPNATSSITCDVANNGSNVVVWDNTPTDCVKKKCVPPPKQANGHFKHCAEPLLYGSKCIYECNLGYRLPNRGIFLISCNANPENNLIHWDTNPSACIRKECEPPADQTNGHRAACLRPYLLGQSCEFKCDDGFELPKGAVSKINCVLHELPNGKTAVVWDDLPSPCRRKHCSPIILSKNALLATCTNTYKYKSKCTIKCKPGYTGDTVHTCGENGKWKPMKNACRKIQCGLPSLQSNGHMVSCPDPHTYGTKCTFKCNKGYELPENGTSEITCVKVSTDDGTHIGWDQKPTPCVAKKCKAPTPQGNGHLVMCSNGYTYQSKCTFACAPGYELPEAGGVTVITCKYTDTGDVEWDDTATDCVQSLPMLNDCPPPNVPANTETTCDTSFTVCTFYCKTGFERFHPNMDSMLCVNGKWTKEPTPCTLIHCPKLYAPANGKEPYCTNENWFQSFCDFKCNAGYTLSPTGRENVICLSNGAWDKEPPHCVVDSCSGPPDDPPNGHLVGHCSSGYLFGSRCPYQCDEGYKQPHGGLTDSVQCVSLSDDAGTRIAWNRQPKPCIKRSCEPPKDPKNGYMAGCTEEFKYKSQCTFLCKEGYELPYNGIHTITCNINTNAHNPDTDWDDDATDCVEKKCQPQESPESGQLDDCTDDNNYGTICKFRCNTGYHLPASGVDRTICTANGTWDKTPSPCIKNSCSPPIIPANADLKSCSDSFNHHSQCTFKCKPGYHMPKHAVTKVTCITVGTQHNETTTWDSKATGCIENRCVPPERPNNADLLCCSYGFQYGSTCTFKCQDGYHLPSKGVTTITCKANGSWDRKATFCFPNVCPKPPKLDHAEQANCSLHHNYGSVCTYECEAGYRSSCAEVFSVTCGANSKWNRTLPGCEAKVCDLPKLPARTHLTGCNKPIFGTVCSITCEEGYHLPPWADNEIQCSEGNNWNSSVTKCVPNECSPPDLPPLVTTAICSKEHDFRSECTFNCIPGYRVKKKVTIKCLASGRWTDLEENPCEVDQCPAVCVPSDKMIVQCTSRYDYGSECRSKCADGYTLANPDQGYMICTTERIWDGDLSRCIKINGCHSNPCQHGGTCEEVDNGYLCLCPFSKHGDTCEMDLCTCSKFNYKGDNRCPGYAMPTEHTRISNKKPLR